MSSPKITVLPLVKAAPAALVHLGLVAPIGSAARMPTVQASAKRERLGPLLHYSPRTFASWATMEAPPSGIGLITLIYLINAAGIDVQEFPLKEATPTMRQLRELMIFGMADAAELASKCDYSQSKAILDTALGRQGIMPTRQATFDKVLAVYATTLNAERERVEREFKDICPNAHPWAASLPAASASAAPAIEVSTDLCQPLRDEEFALLEPYIKQMLPLAVRLANDSTPRGVTLRKRLRELTAMAPSNGVFQLNNALIQLCGEKARDEKKS